MTTTVRSFIVISAILHAGAIAALYDPLPDAGRASPSLRVSLVRTQVATPSSGTQAPTPQVQKDRDVAKSEASVASEPALAGTPAAKATERVVTKRPAAVREPDNKRNATRGGTTQPTTDQATHRVAGIQKPSARQTEEAGDVLRHLFAAHFSYPLLARRKGWEGEVRLGLRLEPDGRLTHVRIVQSSGFPVLDNSAMDTAMKVEKAPDAARWLQGDWFDMVLPVQYRLNDS